MIISSAGHFSKRIAAIFGQLRLRQDAMVSIGLFLLGVLSRLPFRERILYHWDSINFALSLRHFDVTAGQPHVPGYILYVFLARLVNSVLNDEQLALVAISILSSGLAIAFMYLLGKLLFNRATGLLAALFLASSPLFWFYGAIALPHSLDCLVTIVVVWLLYRIRQGEVSLTVPTAVLLGIAGGLRPQTQVFLAPLALYVAWSLSWPRRLVALGVMALVDLAWFIPLVSLSGGFSRYLEVLRQYYLAFSTTTSVVSGGGLWGIIRNLRKLGMYSLYGWSVTIIPAIVAGIMMLRLIPSWKSKLGKASRFWFIAVWVIPGFAYYVLVHMGQQGLVFIFLPALLLLSAAGIYYIPWKQPWYRHLAIATLIIANCAIFLVGPTYPLGGDRPKLLTADTLRLRDTYYLSRLGAIRQNFSDANTILLSSEWRYPEYYLPDYSLVPYQVVARWELGEGSPTLKDERWIDVAEIGLDPDSSGYYYVVIFDDNLIPFNQSPEQEKWIQLPDGQQLAYMRFTSQERIHLDPQSYAIVAAPSDAR